MMKKFLPILFLLVFCNAEAQFKKNMFGKDPIVNLENWDKKRVSWGYFLGFNSYDFKIDNRRNDKEILVDRTTGFNVGLIGDLRLTEFINFRFEPGLYYTQRNLNFPNFEREIDARREVGATYIHLPFLLKFSSLRTGNIRPFLVGGLSTTLNLASNSKATEDNLQNRFRVKQWTNNYELGFGIDFYTEYFKFSPSVRGVFGIGDELIRDNDPNSPYTGNVQSMKTRAVLINFTFQ